MSSETPESSVIYEDSVADVALEDIEDGGSSDTQAQAIGNDVAHDTDDEVEDAGPSNISRSTTATPLPQVAPSEDTVETQADGSQVKKQKVGNSGNSQLGKKVPLHLLEKRRLGRIKAAEEFAKKLKTIGIEKVESTTLPPTGLFQPLLLINQKNYSSDYIRKDDQIFALRERKYLRNANNNSTGTPDTVPTTIDNKSIQFNNEDIDLNDPTTTVVIQPGFESIKIGFALDETPLIVPNCVAIPQDSTNIHKTPTNLVSEQDEEFMVLKSQLYQTFKERMRYYKRRIQPNSHDQVKSFNLQTSPETVQEKNDPNRVPWILPQSKESTDNENYLYGDEAALAPEPYFNHRNPFATSGLFNLESPDYTSIQELLGDVTRLIQYALTKLLQNYKVDQDVNGKNETSNSKDTKRYKVIFVISDLFEKTHLETMIRILLNELPFQAVAVIQESLASCYGAGLGTSTCVVNIGAKETKIACVDEGSVLENSLVSLNYGGDDITKLFAILLKQSQFPYKEWDISTIPGWRIAESLKKELVTFQDAGVTVQLSNFIKREPNSIAEKYEFKIFDEVMLAPLGLFYPKIFKFLKDENPKNKLLREQLLESRDLFTNELNDWKSMTQEECIHDSNLKIGEIPESYSDINDDSKLLKKLLDVNNKLESTSSSQDEDRDIEEQNMLPLDKAIIQSITNASLTIDPAKMEQFYSNILVVGGSSKIEAFDFMLTDRINIWRPRLLSLSSFPNFYKNLTKKIKDLETEFNTIKNNITSATINVGDSENLDSNADENKETADIKDNIDDDDDDEDDDELEKTVEPSASIAETRHAYLENEGIKYEAKVEETIQQELSKYLSDTDKSTGNNEHLFPVAVVPPPKELDSAYLVWKGASVLAQLKLVEELFITYSDWDMHGNRILQYKCIFTY